MAAVKKSVSVKDVARLAGVSEQTVSRTVHDSPSVRPETKERVRAAMRELGYRPNFAGRSLRRGKFKTVGVAMFNITGTGNLDRMEGFAAAFQSALPSFHPIDLCVGVAAALLIRLAVYVKGKNAKKFRKNLEYGSARWGRPEDIAPYVDPKFENNVILTQT